MPEFCPTCGFQIIPEDLELCPNCGRRLIAEKPPKFYSEDGIEYKSNPYYQNQEQYGTNLAWGTLALKLIGLFAIIVGFLMIASIYFIPVSEITNRQITIGELFSICLNIRLDSTTYAFCKGIQDQFYYRWGIALFLLITGFFNLFWHDIKKFMNKN